MSKRKYTSRKTPRLEKHYKESGECCYYCKFPIPFVEITRDHLLPKSKGHTLVDNMVFACRQCNTEKGDRSIREFRENVIGKIIGILQKVIADGWKISNDNTISIVRYSKILKTLTTHIEENTVTLPGDADRPDDI